MNVSDPTRFEFEAACPQCGAAAGLQAGQNVLSCPFCKTRQVLIPSGEPVYIIFPDQKPENLFYAPYWLVQGLHLSVHASRINERFLDATFSGSCDRRIPFSIGLRHQVLKLHALMREVPGLRLLKNDRSSEVMQKAVEKFMRRGTLAFSKTTESPASTGRAEETKAPIIPSAPQAEEPDPRIPAGKWERISDVLYEKISNWLDGPITETIHSFPRLAQGRFLEFLTSSWRVTPDTSARTDSFADEQNSQADSGEPIFQKECEFEDFVEDRLALVYFPFFIREGKLVDGVTREPVSDNPLQGPRFRLARPRPCWTAHPLLCPNCGTDLPAYPDALFFPCGHCDRLWVIREGRFSDSPIEEEPAGRPFDVRFPFWRMTVRIDGISKWGGDGIHWEPSDIVFSETGSMVREIWAPAFRMAPRASLTAAARVTRRPPAVRKADSVRTRGLFPVTLPLEGAFSRCRMILFHQSTLFTKFPPSRPGLFGSLSFQLESSALAYLPFSRMGTEYVHDLSQYALPGLAIRGLTRVEDILAPS